LGAVTGFIYRHEEHKLTSEITEPAKHYWLEPGDLLMTRSNTESLLGHAAIYDGSPSPCIYPDLMMKLKIDDTQADKRFVYYWLRTPDIRDRIQRAGKGTNSSMMKITQKVVMGLPFPTAIGLDEQRELVRDLDSAVTRVERVRARQQKVKADLSALMPSMLDYACQGILSPEVADAAASLDQR
jgi:type I restriction enzyme S subunit